jgi:hypothetical protein
MDAKNNKVEYNWMQTPEIPGKKVELVLNSEVYEHIIISDYIMLDDSQESLSKRYAFIAKYRKDFEGVATFYEVQFDRLFLSLAECQDFAERFIESRPILDEC